MLFALTTPCLRRRRVRWGVSDEELLRSFPGDELVPKPRWQYTHGITVKAPPCAVWPWVAQIGQGRGGFYSYQRLENLVGCRIGNADAIVPELQRIAVGDHISLHPNMPPLDVVAVEPDHALVLYAGQELVPGRAAEDATREAPSFSWAFVVEDAAGSATRLFSRYRAFHGPGWAAALSYGPWIVEPISFVMDVKMLEGIRQRAEAAQPT
jgi:hypothetical protein